MRRLIKVMHRPAKIDLVAVVNLLIPRSLNDITMKTVITIPEQSKGGAFTQVLLFCGLLSTVWYVVINVYVPTQYPGYSLSSLTVSELSAIGAPTRKLWVILVAFYPLLFIAFGLGILQSAGASKALRAVGWLIIGYSIFNIYWPPMHQRGTETTLTDTLHIVWAAITVMLMIIMMLVGSLAFGRRFRIYTFFSIATHFLFGILTGLEAPNIPINGPTPWIGTWERINIGIFMLWVAILSVMLMREKSNRNW